MRRVDGARVVGPLSFYNAYIFSMAFQRLLRLSTRACARLLSWAFHISENCVESGSGKANSVQSAGTAVPSHHSPHRTPPRYPSSILVPRARHLNYGALANPVAPWGPLLPVSSSSFLFAHSFTCLAIRFSSVHVFHLPKVTVPNWSQLREAVAAQVHQSKWHLSKSFHSRPGQDPQLALAQFHYRPGHAAPHRRSIRH
jgi:hypothetical protein